MHDTLRKVGRHDHVLVAFEYGPARADELDLVARPIVRQLAAQGARIALVSTKADGLVAARALVRQAFVEPDMLGFSDEAEVQGTIATGVYRPGEVVGVADVLESSERPDLVVVFSARPHRLRWWVEQVGALPDPPPVVAGTGASAEGLAVAYLSSEPALLAGAVSGASGAAYYERVVDGTTDGPAARRVSALAAGNLAIVVLVIVGAAASGWSGPRAARGEHR
jgi:hypothetical protein